MPLSLLSEKRTWTGRWWLPESPENKVPGELTYDPADGVTLRLFGGWEYRNISTPSPGVVAIHEGLRSWLVVHGIAESRPITLLDLQAVHAKSFGVRVGGAEPDSLQIAATTALVGCHLASEGDAAFVAAGATVENLTTWSQMSGITHEMTFDQANRSTGGQVRYEPLADSPSAVIGEIKAELQHVLMIPDFSSTRSETGMRIVERTSVEFSSDGPRPLQEWLDKLSGVSELVSLSTLTACTEISIHLWGPPSPDAYPADHPLGEMLHEVDVFQRRMLTPSPDTKGGDLRNFILTLDDLSFDLVLPRWFELKNQFAAAQSMILGLSYVTDGFIQTRVVTAVGAAESFHRALDLEPPMTEEEFQALRRVLFAAEPPERKPWLSDRIMHNDPSLRARLEDLARRPGPFMETLVPDAHTWAKEATLARNGIAHDGRSDAHSIEDLYAVAEVTHAVVILNLLSQLGIPPERLARALTEHPILRRAVRLGRDHFPSIAAQV